MSDAKPFIYQCAACGVVFGPQSATDALVAAQARIKELEDAIRDGCGGSACRAIYLLPKTEDERS